MSETQTSLAGVLRRGFVVVAGDVSRASGEDFDFCWPKQDCAGTGIRGLIWGACVDVARIGDLWMWLQLMWLRFEAVRGPAGVVWGRGPLGPKSAVNDTDRTSDNLKLQPHEL